MLGAPLSGNPVSPRLLDPVCNRDRVLVLPRSRGKPARFTMRPAIATIACNARVELGSLPVRVLLRAHCMLRTAMPEAAIHEDGNPRRREGSVRAAREAWDVHPKAESARMQFAPCCNLRSCSDVLRLGMERRLAGFDACGFSATGDLNGMVDHG